MLSTNLDSSAGLKRKPCDFHDAVKIAEVVKVLDEWCKTHSYMNGFSPSQADVLSFRAIKSGPAADVYPHANRWYHHIKSFEAEFHLLRNESAGILAHNEAAADEPNLFDTDSDEEQEDPAVVAAHEAMLKVYREKNAAKKKPVAKSLITLDIKPHGDDIDMDELKASVLQIEMDGLTWGGSMFVPIGYGIRKLQINLIVEDDKVSLDELETKIVDDLSSHVQSMDVFAMQKA